MVRIGVSIEGVSPGLLHHRFPELVMRGMVTPVKLAAKVRATPEEEAEMAAYRMVDGLLAVPSEHIYSCMVRTGGQFLVQGRNKATYKQIIKGALLVDPEPLIPILDGKGEEVRDYEIDARPAVVGRARIIRHRPLFSEWQLNFNLLILAPDELPLKVLQDVLEKGGQTIGIGDYRPRYGRFQVTRWEVQNGA